MERTGLRHVPPGTYENVKNSTYHTWDAVSSSQLKALRRSKYDLQKLWLSSGNRQSGDMLVGELTHDMVLLPDIVKDRYIVAPESFKSANSKKLDVWKADAKRDHPLAVVVTQAQWDIATGVLAAVRKHPVANKLLIAGAGKSELSVVVKDPRSGLLLRARFDRLQRDSINDLKTAKDASPRGFMRAAYWDYHYDVQAVHYLYVAKLAYGGLRDFKMVAVEKGTTLATSSFDVGVYSFPTKWLRTLEAGYAGMLEEYAEVLAAPQMAGYTNDVETLPPPYKDNSITVGSK